jgi:hypothetical protein
MSHLLEQLEVGKSSLDIAVVPSRYQYHKGRYDRIILIAGGTGITPLIHVCCPKPLLTSEDHSARNSR